jgi:hypothetical protein
MQISKLLRLVRSAKRKRLIFQAARAIFPKAARRPKRTEGETQFPAFSTTNSY